MIPFPPPLLRFWKPIAGAVVILFLAWYVRHAWNERYQDGYKEGVAVTEDKQAEVIAERMLENEKRERAMARFVADKQLELQVKENANLVLSTRLDRLASESRLCFADQVRRRPVPEATGTPGNGNAATSDPGPAQTIGSAVVELVTECQRSTDKLVTLQDFIRASR